MSELFKRTTLNLFADDAKTLESIYGYGWTEQVRFMVRRWLKERERQSERLEAQAEDME